MASWFEIKYDRGLTSRLMGIWEPFRKSETRICIKFLRELGSHPLQVLAITFNIKYKLLPKSLDHLHLHLSHYPELQAQAWR